MVNIRMTTNILLLTSSSNVSGPIKGVFQLIDHMKDPKYKFHLYGFRHNNEDETLFMRAVRERGLPINCLIQKNRSYISLIKQMVQVIRENDITIVQTHGFKPTFLGFFARIFCKIKWICFMHGTTNEDFKVRFYNFIDNFLQQAAHKTVIVSEAQRNVLYGGSNTNRVKVLHNAVDLECPMPVSIGAQSVREKFNIPKECKILVAVGRFSPEKGMDVLLDAFALLVQQIDNIHLLLVGEGQERLALEAQVERLALKGMVHFAGYTKTPGDYVTEADILALSSRSEGIPNAVLEAMAMGKPVVASAVGGVPEIVEDGISGLLFPPNEPHLLAEALIEVLTDENLSRGLAVAGRRRVQESFSIKARVVKLQNFYQAVLSEA